MIKTEFKWHEEQELEKAQRALPADQQSPQVIYFGLLGYKIMAVADTQAEAEKHLEILRNRCRANADLPRNDKKRFTLPGWTRDPSEHDFDIRTQADLDALTEAIRSTRETSRGYR